MEVYIEYAIIDNLVMNAILLYLSFYINHIRFSKLRIILSDVYGTIVSIILPLFTLNLYIQLVVKMILALSMVYIALGRVRPKKYVLFLLTFLSMTFLMGGLCMGFIQMLGLECDSGGLLFNDFCLPMGLLILVIAGYVWVIKLLVHTIKSRLKNSGSYVDVDVRKDGVCVHMIGFVDTGNFACDKQGNSLIFLSPRMFCRLFPKVDMTKFVLNRISNQDIAGSYYTKIKAVSSKEQNILVVPIDTIDINMGDNFKSTNNVACAISESNFGGEFDILLSPRFVAR